MPRTPTGRPRGRPKGSGIMGDVRLALRLPSALTQQLTTYAKARSDAGLPRSSVSDVCRDALEHWFACPNIRRTKKALSQQALSTYNDTDQAQPETTGEGEALDLTPSAKTDTTPPTQEPVPAAQPEMHDTPGFDTTRYYLGTLCPKGHNYQGTGHSLRRQSKRDCWDCDRERKRRQRQG
jgi:hypothetical protein